MKLYSSKHFKNYNKEKGFFWFQLKKLFLISVRYGSVLWTPFGVGKNKVYFSNTKTMSKETLNYLIILTKSRSNLKLSTSRATAISL